MVVEKLPIWSVTGSVTGLIAGRCTAQHKAGTETKGIQVWLAAELDLEVGVEGEEGHARRRRHNAHAPGAQPHRDRGDDLVGGRVDY
jgi:hypothetical protein